MFRATAILLLVACNAPGDKKQPAPSPSPASGAEATSTPAPPPPAKRRPVAEPTSVPPFEAEGVRLAGDPPAATTVRISSQKTERPTAYVVLGTSCPTTARYLERIAALEKQHAKAVDFVYLYPNRTDTGEAKRAFHAKHGFRGPLVDDQGAVITQQLRVGRTAELVLAGKDGAIVYRGAVDDNKDPAKVQRKHATLAIEEHLAGKPVSTPKTSGTA